MIAASIQGGQSVETLAQQIQSLVGQRQTLRSGGADREALEQNRREICRLQQQLSLALIARHTLIAA